MSQPDIASYLVPGRRVHLIGIGGVSMSALAEVMSAGGLVVTGSDMSRSETTRRLIGKGYPVTIGHDAALVHGVDCVVRTAAARDDNPEVAETRRLGLPLFERAQAWGFIMGSCAQALCIAGTHGKTTTASMSTHIALEGGLDPTVMIGGTLPLIGAGHRVGSGDLIVMEACEYCDSFLSFSPTIAVILNIEADHLDYFGGLGDIVSSFSRFAMLTPEKGGRVLLCADDPGAMRLHSIPREILTFGLSADADVSASGLYFEGGFGRFAVTVGGEHYADVRLGVPGRHNVRNALGAAAAAFSLGLPGSVVASGLQSFKGAARRFEFVGFCNQAAVVDDYAHHPTEIRATLNAARSMGYSRILCAFQPHTYSRTAAFFDDFVTELGLADRVFLAEIYAARESNRNGMSAALLAEKLPAARLYTDTDDMAQAIAGVAEPGDLIITMGAGDIWKVGKKLVDLR